MAGIPAEGPRILLTGMMGSGKSTVGRALARLSGWPYVDNDELVHQKSGRPTPDLLGAEGQATLRVVEAAALDAALSREPPLIAGVAAGVVADARARERMKANAFVVYLRAQVSLLAERVGDGHGRPWLGEDPERALAQLYRGREPLYRETADLILDVEGHRPDELAARIVSAVGAEP